MKIDGRPSVLLAEDNPVNQKVVQHLLTKWGYKVTAVSNGLEAVSAATERQFDVILMDIQMPEMSGFEAASVIRGREAAQGRHSKIIALTAHARREDRQRCLDAGMDDYVSKPVQPVTLLHALQAATPQVVR